MPFSEMSIAELQDFEAETFDELARQMEVLGDKWQAMWGRNPFALNLEEIDGLTEMDYEELDEEHKDLAIDALDARVSELKNPEGTTEPGLDLGAGRMALNTE